MTKEKSMAHTRRAFLAASTITAAVVTTSSSAAVSGPSRVVTPELATLIAKWQVAHGEYLRLDAIDKETRAHYLRIAPEIPERILLSSYDPYPVLNRNCYAGHLRYSLRCDASGAMPETIRASYWRERLDLDLTAAAKARYAENIRLADEFEAAEVAAYAAAGCEAANDAMEEAFDRACVLERQIEEFSAASWADVVSIVRVSKIANDRDPDNVWRESWDGLIANIERVAAKAGA